jgi:hypothetical protein
VPRTETESMKNCLGQERVTIHPRAAMRSGGWGSGKTSRGRSVEKRVREEPSEQRL